MLTNGDRLLLAEPAIDRFSTAVNVHSLTVSPHTITVLMHWRINKNVRMKLMLTLTELCAFFFNET
jgi:hypothetical protein